jgi:hypothetical protein
MNNQFNTEPKEYWRWKMIRKVADYINSPDDITMSELKALIESYKSHNDINDMIQSLKYN